MALLSRSWYAPGGGLLSAPLYTADSPQILSVGGDNAVTQYERNVVISLLGFGEAIASVTFGGVECQIVSQVLGARVVVNMPGHLATGLYEVSVSGAIESATISGVSYTQTHPIEVPAGITVGGSGADSNSIWQGQGWMPGDQPVYWSGPALPAGWSFIAPVTGWANAPTLQDIRDYIQAPAGFEGTETFAFSRLYADGTVVTWNADVTVSDGSVEPEPPTVTINGYTGTDPTPTLSGTVSAGASVTVSINGQSYAAVVSGANWTAQVTSALPLGTHTATVTATANGLASTQTAPVVIQAASITYEINLPAGSFKFANGVNVSHTFDHWALYDRDPRIKKGEAVTVIDSGTGFQVANGGATKALSIAESGSGVLCIWDGDNSHNAQINVTW